MNKLRLEINDYYFHSIIHGFNLSFSIIRNIVESKAILPPKKSKIYGLNSKNHEDEVCLSKETEKPKIDSYKYLSGMSLYVPKFTSFIIDNSLTDKRVVKKPDLCSTSSIFEEESMGKTNLYDEYRTKGIIELKYIKGLSIPYDNIIKSTFNYLLFMDEGLLMKYYNGLITYEEIKKVNDLCNSKEEICSRKETLDTCILNIEKLFRMYNVNIPIYFYRDDKDDKRLILK